MTRFCCKIVRFGLMSISLVGLLSVAATRQTAPAESTTEQNKSVANAARQAKTGKTRVAKVFTDDDMVVHKSPLPVMNLEGDDNTDLILQAIANYKESHKPERLNK